MGLVLHFRQIANWCTYIFHPRTTGVCLSLFIPEPHQLWACTVFSWYPTQQTVAKGVPWNCECLGLSPGPGKFAIPLNVSMCSLCRTRCRAERELLCSGLSSFLFALPLGIYCPFDRNCEEDCHHLESPPRQGLVLFFLSFFGALKSRGSVHVTWWYPVDHWILDFSCSFFRKFLLRGHWNSSPVWPPEISCQQLICTISVFFFFFFFFFGLFVQYVDLSTPTRDRLLAPCFGSSES